MRSLFNTLTAVVLAVLVVGYVICDVAMPVLVMAMFIMMMINNGGY